jgi:hypothetical protein
MIIDPQNKQICDAIRSISLDEVMGSLQVRHHVEDTREALNKHAPLVFEDLNIYKDQKYRIEATRRLVRLFLDNPDEIVPSTIWRSLLLSNPMFKWVDNYPVIEGYHKYRNEYIYREWLAAEPQYNFLEQLFMNI